MVKPQVGLTKKACLGREGGGRKNGSTELSICLFAFSPPSFLQIYTRKAYSFLEISAEILFTAKACLKA